MNKAVFLDRDGVINRKLPEGRYVTSWAEFEFLPSAADAISLLNNAAYKVIVVTNQRCIAKGLVRSAEIEAIHRRMCRELASAGATIDAVYYCPHEKVPPCTCRKPSPGMLLSAAHDHEIDLADSWMVGDSTDDVEAGKSAGCRTARVIRDHRAAKIADSDIISRSLLGAALEIVRLRFVPSPAPQQNPQPPLPQNSNSL
jgi:D-glycero-D-manno-heptose 1,7-bisphosphate phosphatase